MFFFFRLIPEEGVATENPNNVRKLAFCTGKVYYDILGARREAKLDGDIAIARLEQIAPFPYDLVKSECEKYPNAELVWVQEEHKNMGAWSYIQPRFTTALGIDRHVT